jgi:mono/diheme cytochrome c family protein
MIETRSSRVDALPPLIPAQARIQLSSRWWPALTASPLSRLRGDERMEFPSILSGRVSRAAALAVAAFILSGAGAGCFDMRARAQDAPPRDVANGRSVYLKVNCFQCHGRAGQGGAMNYPAPPLAKTSMPFEGFKMVVRESMRDMPAYNEAVLADKDLVDIYAFLQTLPGRLPAKDIAILSD